MGLAKNGRRCNKAGKRRTSNIATGGEEIGTFRESGRGRRQWEAAGRWERRTGLDNSKKRRGKEERQTGRSAKKRQGKQHLEKDARMSPGQKMIPQGVGGQLRLVGAKNLGGV